MFGDMLLEFLNELNIIVQNTNNIGTNLYESDIYNLCK